MTTKLIVILSLISALTGLFASAGELVVKVGDTVVDRAALNLGDPEYGKTRFSKRINGASFQQDAMVTHKGYQYVGYYDGNRQVCIARRKLPSGGWETIRFDDHKFTKNDAHNTVSIGISPQDGTIHMAFDHHASPLNYRVSAVGAANRPESMVWHASLFGPIRSELEKGKRIKVTYPRFWQTPDGSLQFCYRRRGSGNGDRMLVDYDPKAGLWGDTRQIDSSIGSYEKSRSRCSYPNGYTYGPNGNLHATWVWREGAGSANHDLMYAYSENMGKTWRNNDGEMIKGPAGVDSPGITVVGISEAYGLLNSHGQAVDSSGRVHVVMIHCSDETLKAAGSKPGEHRFGPPAARRYFHYFRNAEGKWETRTIPGVAGNRAKVFTDEADNTYLIVQKSGNLVIMGADASKSWKNWEVLHIEEGPFNNEMLGDFYRWKDSGVLSVMVQKRSEKYHEPTSLRILDFQFKK